MARWNECRPGGRVCPICDRDSHCSIREEDGAVHCHHASHTKGEPLAATAGYRRAAGKDGVLLGPTKQGGYIYECLNDDGTARAPRVKSPEELAQEEAKKEQYKQRQIRNARGIWESARKCVPGDRVEKYLMHRGIDVAKLPGGVMPAMIRWAPECLEGFEKLEVPGRRETYKPIKNPAMVAAVVDAKNQITGVHRTFLDPDPEVHLKRTGGEAKKMIGACDKRAVRLASVGEDGVLVLAEGIETTLAVMVATGWAGWSCLDAGKLSHVELPPALFQKGRVRTIVIAEDLDARGAGEAKGGILANRLRLQLAEWGFPVKVVEVVPCPEVAPTLTYRDEAGEAKPGTPAKKSKGIDWLDVLNGVGAEPMGAHIKAAVEAAEPPADPSVPHSMPSTPPDPPFGNGGDRGLGGEGDGGLGDDDERLRGLVYWHEDATGKRRPCIAAGPREQAMLYLLKRCLRGDRFRIANWAGKWLWWDGGVWESSHATEVFGDVAGFLSEYWRARHFQNRPPRVTPNSVQPKQVKSVMEFIASETFASVEEVPSWLPPSIDDKGQPCFGRQLEMRTRWNPPPKSAASLVPFSNGLLDLDVLVEESRVQYHEHTPRLFTNAGRKYSIDSDLLREAVKNGFTEDIAKKVFPRTWGFLKSISEGNERRLATLQRMIGDTMSANRSIEKVFLLPGPTRSGKGVTITMVESVLGKHACVMAGVHDLGDRFGLASFVGKSAALFTDAHVPEYADTMVAMERIKRISGNDGLTVRDLYQSPQANVKIGTRIWLFMNDALDKMKDQSGAFAGRVVVWPYTQSFLGNEDLTLKSAIKREVAGIALWAICGYVDLWRMDRPDIVTPEAGHEYIKAFTERTSTMGTFVETCCDVGAEAHERGVLVKELYRVYERFTQERGYPAVKFNGFFMQIWSRVPKIGRVNEHTADERYTGISLKRGVEIPPPKGEHAYNGGLSMPGEDPKLDGLPV